VIISILSDPGIRKGSNFDMHRVGAGIARKKGEVDVAETKCAQGRRFQRDPYGAPANMAAIKSSIGQASALLA
jgi:hypothetical protein